MGFFIAGVLVGIVIGLFIAVGIVRGFETVPKK